MARAKQYLQWRGRRIDADPSRFPWVDGKEVPGCEEGGEAFLAFVRVASLGCKVLRMSGAISSLLKQVAWFECYIAGANDGTRDLLPGYSGVCV